MTMLNAHGQPRRHRRCQLSVPASNTKMIQKASESGVDHVFLDLEDACAPNQPHTVHRKRHMPLRCDRQYSIYATMVWSMPDSDLFPIVYMRVR